MESVVAITVKVVPFEENSHIVTLFSKERGKICLAIKKSRTQRRDSYSPLLSIEACVKPSEKEVWKCLSCEVITSFPRLRLNLDTLRYAVGVTQILTELLPLHAPAPELFDEFHAFLQLIPVFNEPHVAATCFLAKLCAIEGVLANAAPLEEDEAMLCQKLVEQPFEKLYGVSCDKALLKKLALIIQR